MKIWQWLKKAGVWISGLLLLVIGAGWLWKRYRSKLGRVQDALAVSKATAELTALQAQMEEVEALVGPKDAAVTMLRGKIEAKKRKIVEGYEGGCELTDDEVDNELRSMGIL